MRTMLILLVVACSSKASSPPPSTPPQSPPPPKQATPADPNCGMRTTDWCPAPDGDPCGEHKDVASCKADATCTGIAYKGESLVACQFDARGFATNCPTVGCQSAGKK